MKSKITSPLLVLSLTFLTFQTAKFDSPGSESKIGRGGGKVWPEGDVQPKPPKLETPATEKKVKQTPPKAEDWEVVEVEGPKKKAPEGTPEAAKKPGFSFKRLFGFGTKTEQPKAPVKTEEPAKLKFAEAEVSDEVKAVKTAVTTISPQMFERFTKLGVSLDVAKIEPEEARYLIETGDKLLKLKPEDLNALEPEEKLKVLTILNARAQQLSQGDSSATSSQERRERAQRAFDAGEIPKQELDRALEAENKKDVEVVEKFGFKKSDSAKTTRSINVLIKQVGTEMSLRIDIAKAQAAEIEKLAQQKTALTSKQKQLRDSHMRNITALINMVNKAEKATPSITKQEIEQTQKTIKELDEQLKEATDDAKIKELTYLRAVAEKRLKDALENIAIIEKEKAQIPDIRKLLSESQKVSKKLAPSFIKDQKAQAKSLEKTINAKKAKLEAATKEGLARIGELDQEKVKKINERAPIKARMNELSEGVEKSQLPEEFKALSETFERLSSEIKDIEAEKKPILDQRKQQDDAIQELENQKKLILSGIDILQEALK